MPSANVDDAAETPERRLAAILAADCVGFSRLLGADEAGTLAAWSRARRQIDQFVAEYRGRTFKVMGDGLLAEFPSSWLALRAAISMQDAMAAATDRPRIVLRIGLHQADVLVQGDDLIGEGVNVAARLEPLCPPGGICLSARVREDVAGRLDLPFVDGGERQLKNIDRRHRLFFLLPPAAASTSPALGEADETTILVPGLNTRFSLLVLSSASPGPEPGSVVPLQDRSFTLGRQPPSDLLLPHSVVSRTHCTLDHFHGTTILTDLRSTNGTFVDGRRVDGPTALLPGALIRIGPFLLQYTADPDP